MATHKTGTILPRQLIPQTPIEHLTNEELNAACECGHARRDHFPASDAETTGKVCTGQCKSIDCHCSFFVALTDR